MAQHMVYKQHASAMYSISVRIVGNTGEAEDVVQQSFIQAFSKLYKLDDESLFGPWLKKIVVNNSIDKLRRRKVQFLSLDDDHHSVMALYSAPTEIIENRTDTVECIKQAILQLPDGYRSILSLYLIEGYDHSEISEILGISESTSRSQYARAKIKLREILKNNFKIQR
ncbi:hypothetical protein GCM10025777_01830 [Membranihabitans marinus]